MSHLESTLSGKTILVLESDQFVGSYVVSVIEAAGGEARGPFQSAEAAFACIASDALLLDAALLNVVSQNGDAYRVADELARRLIPFFFSSAAPAPRLPIRFSGLTLLEKPFAGFQVVEQLAGMLGRSGRAGVP